MDYKSAAKIVTAIVVIAFLMGTNLISLNRIGRLQDDVSTLQTEVKALKTVLIKPSITDTDTVYIEDTSKIDSLNILLKKKPAKVYRNTSTKEGRLSAYMLTDKFVQINGKWHSMIDYDLLYQDIMTGGLGYKFSRIPTKRYPNKGRLINHGKYGKRFPDPSIMGDFDKGCDTNNDKKLINNIKRNSKYLIKK